MTDQQQYPESPNRWTPEGAPPDFPAPAGPGSYFPYPPPRKPPLRRSVKALIAVLVVLVVAFGSATGILLTREQLERPVERRPASSASSENPWSMLPSQEILPYKGEKTDFTLSIQKKSGTPLAADAVFTKVCPSVVGIVARLTDPEGEQSNSQATGILASADGVILTNAHVVADSTEAEVVVILHDKRQFKAHILGIDRTTDLAALKISATGLTPAQFGDAGELKVGESVVAIGNADGLNYADSLTGGLVSALDRPIAGHSGNGMTYIQTDAAINPGNSGGPLCNLYGQVVGINSSKIVTSGYEGIGFSIPVSKSVDILNQLIRTGHVQGRVKLGITCRPISTYQAAAYGLQGGMELVSIAEDSAFEGTGIQKGDILYQLDGNPVTSIDDVDAVLQRHKPGDTVKAALYMPGQKRNRTVTITLKAES